MSAVISAAASGSRSHKHKHIHLLHTNTQNNFADIVGKDTIAFNCQNVQHRDSSCFGVCFTLLKSWLRSYIICPQMHSIDNKPVLRSSLFDYLSINFKPILTSKAAMSLLLFCTISQSATFFYFIPSYDIAGAVGEVNKIEEGFRIKIWKITKMT